MVKHTALNPNKAGLFEGSFFWGGGGGGGFQIDLPSPRTPLVFQEEKKNLSNFNITLYNC